MYEDTDDGRTDGGTDSVDSTLDPIRERREAVEAHLLDRDDDLGAMARAQLALVDGDPPDPDDLETLGIADPRDSDDFKEYVGTQGGVDRPLSAAVVGEWVEATLDALGDRDSGE